MNSSHTVVIRNATAADADPLADLASLDSRGPLTGPAMLGEVDGVVRVALDLHDASVAADPFAHTAKLIELLKSPLLSADRAAMTQPRRSPVRGRIVGWSWAERGAAGLRSRQAPRGPGVGGLGDPLTGRLSA